MNIFWLLLSGGSYCGWWWIYFGWQWVVVGGGGYILAGGGWWWVVAQFSLTHNKIINKDKRQEMPKKAKAMLNLPTLLN